MMKKALLASGVLNILLLSFIAFCLFKSGSGKSIRLGCDTSVCHEGAWSSSVNGLKIRLLIKEELDDSPQRLLVPYLEMSNEGSNCWLMNIPWSKAFSCSVVDSLGNEAFGSLAVDLNGLSVPIGNIILPCGSVIRIDISTPLLGVAPQGSTPSAKLSSWYFEDKDNGKLYLNASISSIEEAPPASFLWHGRIVAPPLLISWR